jgi:hypothetical protein
MPNVFFETSERRKLFGSDNGHYRRQLFRMLWTQAECFGTPRAMSAFVGKADIAIRRLDVR